MTSAASIVALVMARMIRSPLVVTDESKGPAVLPCHVISKVRGVGGYAQCKAAPVSVSGRRCESNLPKGLQHPQNAVDTPRLPMAATTAPARKS